MDEQLLHKQRLLPHVRRFVIKIGSSLLSTIDGIDHDRMRRLVDEIQSLVARGYEVVIVSSGAIAAGLARLGRKERPTTIPQKQAAAAVGQIGLMALYEEYFGTHGQYVAQILLTHDDLAHRRRYLNARHTFDELLGARIVPVVNENDSVVIEEMKSDFGDNDNLSALVATLVDADLLVILSDVPALYTANPSTHPDAAQVPLVECVDTTIMGYVGSSASPLGTGGMETKLVAAQKATEAGIPCIVANGRHSGVLPHVFAPDIRTGTLFLPSGDRLTKRKLWIAHALKPAGALIVDQGAYEAVSQSGRSLLPRGLTAIKGTFGVGDCVSCVNPAGQEFARGLAMYGSADLEKIKGLHSSSIEAALGYKMGEEIIHRNDLVLLTS